jgi:NTE family protein
MPVDREQWTMPMLRNAVNELRRVFTPRAPGIVLALGGGGAGGLAHIGVMQVLSENNVHVRAIAGTSIGAEIGAFYASGMSGDELAAVATEFDWKQTLALFVPDLPTGGIVSGVRILDFLRGKLGTRRIEELPIRFAAIAVDLESGDEVVLDSGDLVEAVRASVSLPGLIAPHRLNGRALVDGGVLNPLPFDVAHERFGGPVIAVAVQRSTRTPPPAPTPQWLARVDQLLQQPWMARAPGLRAWLSGQLESRRADHSSEPAWTTRRVLDRVFEMSQAQIVRLRQQRHPPEMMIAPDVGEIGVLEFYRAGEAIAAGRRAAESRLPEILKLARIAA